MTQNSMKNAKSRIVTFLIVGATLVLAGIAVFTAIRLYTLKDQPVAPTAPESEPEAADIAPVNRVNIVCRGGGVKFGGVPPDMINNLIITPSIPTFNMDEDSGKWTLRNVYTIQSALKKVGFKFVVATCYCPDETGGSCNENCILHNVYNSNQTEPVNGVGPELVEGWPNNVPEEFINRYTRGESAARFELIREVDYECGKFQTDLVVLKSSLDKDCRGSHDAYTTYATRLECPVVDIPEFTCNSWSDVNIQGCTWDKWSSNPRGSDCVIEPVDASSVRLNLNVDGATKMQFVKLSNSGGTIVPCDTLDDSADWSALENYATTKIFDLGTSDPGEVKVCGRFFDTNNQEAKCGGIIEIEETGSPLDNSCEELTFTVGEEKLACNDNCAGGGDCEDDLTCEYFTIVDPGSGDSATAWACRNPECVEETDCICPTATATASASPSSSPTSSASPNPTPTPTSTATATASPTTAPAAPTTTPTSTPQLPNAGVGTPTVISIGAGILLLVLSLALAL